MQHALIGERGKRVFRMGDGIRVKVAQVSTERKQIDFVLAEVGSAAFPNPWETTDAYPRIEVRGKRPKSVPGKDGKRTRGGGRGNGR
jgi:ribonuclease R